MHTFLFDIALVWLVVLICVCAGLAFKHRAILERSLAIDTLTIILIGVLALFAFERDEPAYLDVAMMLALLAYIQTVAVSRIVAGKGMR